MANFESVKSESDCVSVAGEKRLNVLMLGETKVGKTALLKAYTSI